VATKLNQIIAVEKGAKSTLENEVTRVYHLVQKAEVFNGLTRVYTPKDDEGEQLPGEGTNVITNVEELVQAFSGSMTKLFDITATKNVANTKAKANVVIDGETVLEDIPVELLLFLEKRLGDCLVFLNKLPVLDPAQKWEQNGQAGVYQTEPTITNRTKKIPRNHEKAPATDKHAAQVEVYYEDTIVGTWATTKFSGASTQKQLKEWRDKVLKFSAAVKMAREEANSLEVTDVKIGEKVFTNLFGELGHA
jgi:hypothetical protein